MKRLLLILTIASVTLCQTVHAQYYSVNYDTRTVAAMVAAFGTEAVAEGSTGSRSMTSSSTTRQRRSLSQEYSPPNFGA